MRRNVFGFTALVISAMALLVAFYQDQLGQLLFAPEATTLKERVIEASRSFFDRGTAYFSGKPAIYYLYTSLGFAGIITGVVAFVRGDNWRLAAAACAVGTAAVAWEYILIGIVVAIIIGFIMALKDGDISLG